MQMHIHRVTALIIIMPAWFNGSRIPHISACLSSAKMYTIEFWVLMLHKYSFSTLGSKGGALQMAQKYLHMNIKEE